MLRLIFGSAGEAFRILAEPTPPQSGETTKKADKLTEENNRRIELFPGDPLSMQFQRPRIRKNNIPLFLISCRVCIIEALN
jgi:hypothetical protein